MKVGIFGPNYYHRTAMARGFHISNIFEIGQAVLEIWSFLDLGHKMRPKLVLSKVKNLHFSL